MKDKLLLKYYHLVKMTLEGFVEVKLKHIPRGIT